MYTVGGWQKVCITGWFCLWLLGWGQVSAQTGQPAMASVEGFVVDRQTGQPIAFANLSVQNEQGQTVARQQTAANGAFRMRLNPQQRYTVEVQAEGYQNGQDVIDFTVPYVRQVTGKRLRLTATAGTSSPPAGDALLSVYFPARQATLSPAAIQSIREVMGRLMASTGRVVLTGFTDGQGNPSLNELLAADRTAAVKAFMINNGIRSERITVRAAGADRPDNNAPLARKRRVDIRID